MKHSCPQRRRLQLVQALYELRLHALTGTRSHCCTLFTAACSVRQTLCLAACSHSPFVQPPPTNQRVECKLVQFFRCNALGLSIFGAATTDGIGPISDLSSPHVVCPPLRLSGGYGLEGERTERTRPERQPPQISPEILESTHR